MTLIKVDTSKCPKCGVVLPGEPEYSFARSMELRSDNFYLWFSGDYDEQPQKIDVRFCHLCRRELEAIMYNWINGLTLDHTPFS